MKIKKVFLGGTCNNSGWRNKIIPLLDIEYFNPVVDDWTIDAQKEEVHQRKVCDFVLYTITPKMKGVYSIAELVDDSNKAPHKTVFCLLEKDEKVEFDNSQLKSLKMVQSMVKNNGVRCFGSLIDVANFLNNN